MNIEEAIDVLKNSIADYVIGEYCEKCADNKICDDRNEDCYYQQAIDIVVTAYENLKSYNKGTKEALRVAEDLEHQANKEAGDWEARCFELETELEKEKEKNSKAIGHIEACKTSLGNYILSPNETEYLLSILKEE